MSPSEVSHPEVSHSPEVSSSIDEVAARYVERRAALSPIWAASIGIPGHQGELDDLSPDGVAASHALIRDTLAAIDAAESARGVARAPAERVAAAFMRERLSTSLQLSESEWHRSLRSMASPVHAVRLVFEELPRASGDDLAAIAATLARVPQSLAGYAATLRVGLQRGETVARRQVEAVVADCGAFTGRDGSGPFTDPLVVAAERVGGAVLRDEVRAAAGRALQGFEDLRTFLVDDYLPSASEQEAVGPERYARFAATFTGARLDLAETEAWGWEEVSRLRSEVEDTVAQLPGAGYSDAIDHLENEPSRCVVGTEAMIAWLQQLLDRTVDELDGVHFTIPERVRRLQVVPAPPGGPPVAYYTGPDEGFTRPGRYWFPVGGRDRFPTWQEVSIAYHEGVPGHHLEIAMQRHQADRLNRMQTTTLVSGYSEGWALYAERLMDELGFLGDPGDRLGMLIGQLFRAVRVVIDIGLHLQRTIPAWAGSADVGGGERWTPQRAHRWLADLRFLPDAAVDGEVARYLGLPGQAISYKVGERSWRRAREAVRRADPQGFSLQRFHALALSLGVMGLDLLETALPEAAGPARHERRDPGAGEGP